MANLTIRRNSQPSSPTRLTPLPENQQSSPYTTSPSQISSIASLASLAKTKGYSSAKSSSSMVSERSDSGISECSINTEDSLRNGPNNYPINSYNITNGRTPTGRGLQSGKAPSLNWQSSVDSAVDEEDFNGKNRFSGSTRKISNETLLQAKADSLSSHTAHSRT